MAAIHTPADRDPGNLRATTKPQIDGPCDSCLLWPDGYGVWVTDREPGGPGGDLVVVRLRPAPVAWRPEA